MDERKAAFVEACASPSRSSVLGEFWAFACHTKKWWLFPVLVVLLLFGLLIALGQTAAAPFIYTLF